MTAPAQLMPEDPTVSMELLDNFKEFSMLLEKARKEIYHLIKK
jgi:hypothetical protein